MGNRDRWFLTLLDGTTRVRVGRCRSSIGRGYGRCGPSTRIPSGRASRVSCPTWLLRVASCGLTLRPSHLGARLPNRRFPWRAGLRSASARALTHLQFGGMPRCTPYGPVSKRQVNRTGGVEQQIRCRVRSSFQGIHTSGIIGRGGVAPLLVLMPWGGSGAASSLIPCRGSFVQRGQWSHAARSIDRRSVRIPKSGASSRRW